MASIHKRGKKYYVYWREPDGTQKGEAVSTKYSEARARKIEIESELNNGTYVSPSDTTFADFAEEWINYYAKPRFKPTSLETTLSFVNTHFISYFGDRRLSDISLYDFDQYIALKLSEGLAVTSIQRHLTPLKTMFKTAVKWGFIKTNPAEDLEKPKARKKEMNFLTPAEIPKLLEHVHPNYFSIIFTAIFTGMRISELLAITWDDVDFEANTIRVNKQLYKGKFTDLKTDAANRKIFMSPALKQVLLTHKEKCPKGDLNLVFPTEDGGPKQRNRIGKRGLASAVKNAGIKKNIRVHDLRHTFATLLISQKETLKFIQQQMGHNSINVTIGKYGHLIPEDYEDVGERLDKRILGDDVNKVLTDIQESAKNNLKKRIGRHHKK